MLLIFNESECKRNFNNPPPPGFSNWNKENIKFSFLKLCKKNFLDT